MAAERVAPTIVDLAPAIGWDEREAHDRDGMRFAGHEPLRPLLDHPADPAAWTVPVDGDDAYDVAVGPIHAGVIESGHFRFHVVGERILHLDARLFYKHRGLERLAEGRSPDDGLALWSAPARPAPSATRSRTAARARPRSGDGRAGARPRARPAARAGATWSHLNDIAAVCAGVGFAAGNQLFAALTDRARELNARVGGHRFLRGTVAVGAERAGARRGRRPAGARGAARASGAGARGLAGADFNGSFQDRLGGVGVLAPTTSRELGATGPAARAAGLAEDVRGRPGATRASRPSCRSGRRATSRARLEQRALELWQSLELLDEALDGPVEPVAARPGGTPRRHGVARVESPRGATTCSVALEQGRIARAAPAHGVVRQLARRRARRGRQPAARLPAHQQELRALLRLRGSLAPCWPCSATSAGCAATSACRARPGAAAWRVRHVDAGSCNGCEHELTLASNPLHDLARFGLGMVASPRHADVLLVTGPVTTRMREPLLRAYAAMPEPRRVAALGDCALGVGLLGHPDELAEPLETLLPVELRIPGCPPSPAAIASALHGLLDTAPRRA